METGHNGSSQPAAREWYAVHTRARHEKAIAARLGEQATEVYLPLHRRRKKWRNGVHAEVDFPLLPCYLFARIPPEQKGRLLATRGVLGFAETETVTQEEIEQLRAAAHMKAIPHAAPNGGEKIRISAGPLAGMSGELEANESGNCIVLSFPPMRRAIAVPLAGSDFHKIS